MWGHWMLDSRCDRLTFVRMSSDAYWLRFFGWYSWSGVLAVRNFLLCRTVSDMILCRWASSSWRFEGSWCVHIQDTEVKEELGVRWSKKNFSRTPGVRRWMRHYSSKHSELLSQSPRWHISEDLSLQYYRCESLRSRGLCLCWQGIASRS
jgi:hypothetical protein